MWSSVCVSRVTDGVRTYLQTCPLFVPAAGGTRYWKRAGASGKGLDSLEVEMTSYVLLALLSGPSMPGFDLEYSSAIVRWLTQQQNPFGGFSSTQVSYTTYTFNLKGGGTLNLC